MSIGALSVVINEILHQLSISVIDLDLNISVQQNKCPCCDMAFEVFILKNEFLPLYTKIG